jgi:DNA-binding transcriptional regulator YiaG
MDHMKSLSTIERLLELNAWIDSDEHLRLRKHNRVPQKVIAKTVGVSQGCVSKWETKRTRPAGEQALAYHRALRAIADAEGRT